MFKKVINLNVALFNRFDIRIVFLLALFLRLLYTIVVYYQAGSNTAVFLGPYEPKWNDSYEYLNVAENFVNHRVITTGNYPDLIPYIDKPPLYPIFIGLLGGVQSLWPVIFIQLIISSSIVFLIFNISVLLWNNRIIGSIASLLYAVNLQSIVYSPLLLTEALFTFVLSASIYLLIRFILNNHSKDLYFSFLLIIIGIFIRPVGYYYFFVILSVVILHQIYKNRNFYILIHASILSLVFLSTIGAWQYRNYKLTEFTGFSAVSVDFKYSYIAPRLLSKDDPYKLDQIRREMGAIIYSDNYFKIYPEQKDWSRGKILHFKDQTAKKLIKKNIATLCKFQVIGMIKTLIKRIDYESFQIRPFRYGNNLVIKTVFNSFYILNIIMLLLCIFSLFKAWDRGYSYWILVFTVFYFITLTGIHGMERYRAPVMPLMLIIASFSAYHLLFLNKSTFDHDSH